MAKKCMKCNGTGKIEVPNNEEIFDREFDRLFDEGVLSTQECLQKALEAAGYTIGTCDWCNGSGIKKQNGNVVKEIKNVIEEELRDVPFDEGLPILRKKLWEIGNRHGIEGTEVLRLYFEQANKR
ncbi:MAG: hypothetical protein RR585_04725 [Coprobacillus sp.]